MAKPTDCQRYQQSPWHLGDESAVSPDFASELSSQPIPMLVSI